MGIAKNHIPSICAISSMYSAFNFDMLKAIVEEMNRYNESPSEVLRFLNTRPGFQGNSDYKVTMRVNGIDVNEKEHDMSEEWYGNPLREEIKISYYKINTEEDNDKEWTSERFGTEHLESMDSITGKYSFLNQNNSYLTLVPMKPKFYLNYEALPTVKTNVEKLNGGGKEIIDIPMIPMDY